MQPYKQLQQSTTISFMIYNHGSEFFLPPPLPFFQSTHTFVAYSRVRMLR